jgi:hypothetical protein
MKLWKLRRSLYRSASLLGDIEALASGSPTKIMKRAARKRVWRMAGGATRRGSKQIGL